MEFLGKEVFTDLSEGARHEADLIARVGESEEKEFQELARAPGMEEVMELINVFEERAYERGVQEGIEKGIEEGSQEGLRQGANRAKRETLVKQLKARFESIPAAAIAVVQEMEEADLDDLLERVVSAERLEAPGLPVRWPRRIRPAALGDARGLS